MPAMSGPVDIEELARQDGRFAVEAFAFVGEGLRHAAKRSGKDQATGSERHLTAGELVEGVLDLAAERFGLLADLVLRSWGLTGSGDIGSITFTLISHGVFSKQPSDRLEDFLAGPDFASDLVARCRTRLLSAARA